MTDFGCTACLPNTTMPLKRVSGAPTQSLRQRFSWSEPARPMSVLFWQGVTEAKDPGQSVMAIEKSILEFGGRRFTLREPLELRVERHGSQWVFESHDPDISGCAESIDEALRDLSAQFAYVWDEFAGEDDSRLGSWARQLKRDLLQRVARVDELG